MADAGVPAAPAAPSASSTPAPEAIEAQDNQDLGDEGLDTEVASAPAPKKDVKAAADKVDAEKVPGSKMYKVVVDGQEEEMSEADLIRYAQKSKAADKRFQESAQVRKEAAELINMLRNNPERVLADPAILGSDEKVLEFAQKILEKRIQDEQKSPDVRAKEKAEQELEAMRAERKKEKEDRDAADYQKMLQQHETQLEEQIQSAIEGSGMIKSPLILKRMADVMISSLENNKEISPKQAMNIVKREMHKDLREYFDASPEDVLEELLGSDNIKRLRKRQVAKIKAETPAVPTASSVKEAAGKGSSKEPAGGPKVSIRNWLRNS